MADFEIIIPRRKPERIEVFNFRNKKNLSVFSEITNCSDQLVKCFENNNPVEKQFRDWMKEFNSIIHQCFQKIRVKNKNVEFNKIDNLLDERRKLKVMVCNSEKEKYEVEDRIENKCNAQ